MSTFPTAKDAFVNPTPTTPKNDPAVPLSSAISRLNSAVVAIQDTVGITASVDPASIQYRLADVQAVAAAADQAISAHVVAGDPHSQYTTQTEVLTLAPAETGSTIGALVVAGADVTSPQDVDLIALSVSSVLRKFSWANMKAALAQIFPLLAGASGGQTINGGTTAGQNLTLRSTAHATKGAIIFGSASEYDEANNRLGIGTLTPAAKVHSLATTEQLRLGYDASNYCGFAVNSAGDLSVATSSGITSFASQTSTATTSAELLQNNSFVADLSGWTDSGATWSWSGGSAQHTAGAISTLTQSVSVQSGATYVVAVTISGRTAGSVQITLDGTSLVLYGATIDFTATATRPIVASTSGTVNLVITPTSAFDGKIDAISLKQLTVGTAKPTIAIMDSGGAAVIDLRASTQSVGSSYIGYLSGESAVSTAANNVALGAQAMRANVTGNENVAIGAAALRFSLQGMENVGIGRLAAFNLSSGYSNVLIGSRVSYALTTGYDNVCIGAYAGYSSTNSNSDVAIGRDALYAKTVGSNVVAIGKSAARYIANGSTQLSTASNCVYIGGIAKASADSVTNENVFGYNATGIGSNSCVIGSSAVTKCQIFGDIILDKTVTAGGTTGAQTINKTVGSVNFAAGATSLVVTNNRVTTASVIVATVATNDTTMKTVLAVAAAGSFTIHANAAATAETRVNFIVIN